jgi:hypothetical protein
MRTPIVPLACLVVACGGAVVDVDGGTQDSGPDTGCTDCFDAPPVSFSCGKSFCSGVDAVCIHPCCGGAILCAPLEDGGACAPGLELSQTCPPDAPCSNTCTPPPPYCGTTKDCSMPQGHDCYLMCQ